MQRVVTTHQLLEQLKKLHKEHVAERVVIPELNAGELKKLNLLLQIQYVNIRTVNGIVSLMKRNDNSLLASVLARTLFESSVNMSLIYLEKPEDGCERYLNFQYADLYKNYLKLEKISRGMSEAFYTPEEIANAKGIYDSFKQQNFSLQSWFGKNLFDTCEYIDSRYRSIVDIDYFFTKNYLQTYSFLSNYVHGTAASLQAVTMSRLSWPFGKFVHYRVDESFDVSILYHTISAYLSILCINSLALMDKKRYERYKSQLTDHFGLVSNSFNKRKVMLPKEISKSRC